MPTKLDSLNVPLPTTTTEGSRLSQDRRSPQGSDELPADILALLVSCGLAVRGTDLMAIDEVLRQRSAARIDVDQR